MWEIQSQSDLDALLRSDAPLSGLRLQGVDLVGHTAQLLARTDYAGTVVLGGRLGPELDAHLRAHGVLVFPVDPGAPIDPYRARLYHPRELYAGLEDGYAATPDARAYAWATDARVARDTFVTTLRAIHDDGMTDALMEALDGHPAVGVMGGHTLSRGSPAYAQAMRLGHLLADAGQVVVTGGGPGAMEAANLGAYARTTVDLDRALEMLAGTPRFDDVTAWARVAMAARRVLGEGVADGERPRSVGIPTWSYGHEPPNVFCDGIAKYFSNALREDGLLARSATGIVVLPGAAGTVQEVFQAATPLFYAPPGAPLPRLVLVGVEHWAGTLPVWPLVQSLAADRDMASAVHLVDDVDAAVAAVTG